MHGASYPGVLYEENQMAFNYKRFQDWVTDTKHGERALEYGLRKAAGLIPEGMMGNSDFLIRNKPTILPVVMPNAVPRSRSGTAANRRSSTKQSHTGAAGSQLQKKTTRGKKAAGG